MENLISNINFIIALLVITATVLCAHYLNNVRDDIRRIREIQEEILKSVKRRLG